MNMEKLFEDVLRESIDDHNYHQCDVCANCMNFIFSEDLESWGIGKCRLRPKDKSNVYDVEVNGTCDNWESFE